MQTAISTFCSVCQTPAFTVMKKNKQPWGCSKFYEMSHLTTKSTKWHMRPAKTKISLGWSESSLSTWRNHGSLATHWVQREDSDQTGRMPRLIWVFAGRTCHFVGFVMRQFKLKSSFLLYCTIYVVYMTSCRFLGPDHWSEWQICKKFPEKIYALL